MKPFSDFTSVFFWNYKRMDNTNYNFDILTHLCYLRKEQGENNLLNKPIILLITAIIECILYDFVRRVNEHSQESIPNLDTESIHAIRAKIIDDFEPLIAHVKKNNLLRINSGDGLYDDLDFLRKLRNRIHIQNKYNLLDKDEYKIWTSTNLKLAGYLLERVCEVLSHVYPRPEAQFIPMSEFPRPWIWNKQPTAT